MIILRVFQMRGHRCRSTGHHKNEGVSKSTPSFLYDKAPTFTSWGFVIT